MGKYIRKSKTTSEVAVMDLSFGVRTRAKTLALQRQRQIPPPLPPPPPPSPPSSAGCYLQLRSRRLVKKPPILVHVSKRQKHSDTNATNNNNSKKPINPNSNNDSNDNHSNNSGSGVRVRPGLAKDGENREERNNSIDNNIDNNDETNDLGDQEASFGENILDSEARERSTRESTPCSLIRDPESIRTPGSTTRPSSTETNRRIHNSMLRHIPTSHEIDEFFSGAEEEQQRQFIEKYNFDPVNDKPLPGRYEWEKLDP